MMKVMPLRAGLNELLGRVAGIARHTGRARHVKRKSESRRKIVGDLRPFNLDEPLLLQLGNQRGHLLFR